jgi:DHA1 family tetracycline resistance protein-like MFS transporter
MIDGLIRKPSPARTHRTSAEADSRAAVLIPSTSDVRSVVRSANDADLAIREEWGWCFGWPGTMRGMGFLVGPLVGGHLGAQDSRAPFLLAAVMAGIHLAAG